MSSARPVQSERSEAESRTRHESRGDQPAGAIGLIAGNGRLPFLFAVAARAQGLRVIAVGHRGETDPALEQAVDRFTWVRIGQVNKILRSLKDGGAHKAVMAGGFGRMRAFAEARPDLGALAIVSRLRAFRDDALLREIARWFEDHGVSIASPTELLPQALAPEGLLAGPKLSSAQQADVALGMEVAAALGQVDVGQTVVVRGGHVLALEAVEGTDETLRRAGRLSHGPGGVVVKRSKPGQDDRFDLPAVGPRTIEVMQEAKLDVLAVEAGRSIVLDAAEVVRKAERAGITVVGVVHEDKGR